MGNKQSANLSATNSAQEATRLAEDDQVVAAADFKNGLNDVEVASRRSKYGFNETPDKRIPLLLMFLKHFVGLVPALLAAAIIIDGALGEYANCVLIAILVLFNAILGFVQEVRARKQIDNLKAKLTVYSRVLRHGEWKVLPARELVPGDIVRVRPGDFVPADFRVADTSIAVDKSALTGETKPEVVEPGHAALSGCMVKSGETFGVVTRTGLDTFFGKSVQLVQESEPKLHIQSVLFRLTIIIILGVLFLLCITVVVFLATPVEVMQNTTQPISSPSWPAPSSPSNFSALTSNSSMELIPSVNTTSGPVVFVKQYSNNFSNILPLIVVLIISAVPFALPAMFTITMAYASHQLVKKGIMVARLNSTFDAASMSVLCSDKTGTITQNKINVAETLVNPYLNEATEEELLLTAALSSKIENDDALDTAVINKAKEMNLEHRIKLYELVQFDGFTAETRRTTATVKLRSKKTRDDKYDAPPGSFVAVKGATMTIVDLCNVSNKLTKKITSAYEEFSAKGWRTLAVARGPTADRLQFLGLIAFSDPPRADSKSVIETLNNMGIRVIMLTGDNCKVARSIAEQVGLGNSVHSLHELKSLVDNDEKRSSSGFHGDDDHGNAGGSGNLGDVLDSASGFAEILPSDKHTVVVALQKRGYVVGMTGDGVNDAPALKQAEVGVAVSNATDVAKGAASAVMTEEGLQGIPHLVEVGRGTHQRLVAWTVAKVLRTMQQAFFLVLVFLIKGYFAVDDGKLFILIFLLDFVIIAMSTDNVKVTKEPAVFRAGHVVGVGVILGVITVGQSLGLLWIGFNYFGMESNEETLHTFVFDMLLFFGLLSVFVCRDHTRWFWASRPSWLLLIAVVADILIGGILASVGIEAMDFQPIPLWQTLVVLGYAAVMCFLLDCMKMFIFHVLIVPKNRTCTDMN